MMDAVQGSDGNLVMEYLYTDEYTLRSIEANSLSPYTCGVQESYFHACLDIASVSTLTYSGNVDDNTSAVSFDGIAETHLFGAKESCSGRTVGDGIINGYDLVVLMWTQFRVAPYTGLQLTHPTVSLHEDTGARCTDTITRDAYIADYDPSTPCVHPTGSRRLLGDDSPAPLLTIHRYTTTHGRGSWFQLRSHGTAYAAMEVLLGGVHSTATVSLSNDRAPLNTSETPNGYEVRFARHEEYCHRDNNGLGGVDGASGRCANVRGIVSTGVALYHNVLSLGQVPTAERSDVCAYDVFLYVPGTFDCNVDILSGSSIMDGKNGQSIRARVACDDAPILACDAAKDARGAISFDVVAPGGGGDRTTSNIAIATSSSVGVLLVLLIALAMWILRNQRVAMRRAPRPPVKDMTYLEADLPQSPS